jgi:hypothetical protein
MINFGPNYTLRTAISSSRLDVFCHCSAKYAANYIYKIPDKGNSGSSRGDVCHRIFELLGVSKRSQLIQQIILADTCRSFPALWKLIEIYSKQNGVCDKDNLDMIDFFIVTGLIWDKKPDNVTEVLIEKDFDFEVIDEDRDIKYRLRGFIDKIYLITNDDGKQYVICRDYKSSKDKFKKDKMKNNAQAYIYQLAIKYLFPQYEFVSFEFIFLKFRKAPIQCAEVYKHSQLEGYEHYLTEIQAQMERFNLKHVNDNIAFLDISKKALCGTGAKGFKPDGKPIWICPAREPMEYWVELDDKGAIKKSYFNSLDNMKLERRFYPGCSFFYDEKGKKRSLSFQ